MNPLNFNLNISQTSLNQKIMGKYVRFLATFDIKQVLHDSILESTNISPDCVHIIVSFLFQPTTKHDSYELLFFYPIYMKTIHDYYLRNMFEIQTDFMCWQNQIKYTRPKFNFNKLTEWYSKKYLNVDRSICKNNGSRLEPNAIHFIEFDHSI